MQQSEKIETVSFTDVNSLPLLNKQSEKRILAFDFARGVAIVAMVAIHSIVFVGSEELRTTSAGYLCNSIISFLAAPVFMFIMGILFAFSSKASLKRQLFRGFLIFALGYALNLFRGTIPIALALQFEWIAEPENENPWLYLLEDDILQFAGLALVALALVKRLFPWKTAWFILAGLITFTSPFLWNKGVDQPVVNYLISLFTGSEAYNFFPFFPWIVFPLFGMAYGELLKTSNKADFFKASVLTGIFLGIVGFILSRFSGDDLFYLLLNGKFRQGQLPSAIIVMFLSFQCIWVPFCNWLSAYIPENTIFNHLYYWSKNVTSFYFLQWVILGFLCVILPYLNWPGVVLCIIVVTYFSDMFVRTYRKMFNQ